MKLSATQKGFSLVELMIVIAIISILAAFAYPSYMDYVYRSRIDNARATMMDVITSMERHYANNNTFCKSNGTKCEAPDIVQTNQFYNFGISNITANGYTLVATPKNEHYSSDVLAQKTLFIQYDSTSANFSRCTSSGIEASKNTTSQTVTGCEIM